MTQDETADPIAISIAFCIAIALTTALYLFLSRTDFGRAIRATAQSPQSSALIVVNVQRIDTITF